MSPTSATSAHMITTSSNAMTPKYSMEADLVSALFLQWVLAAMTPNACIQYTNTYNTFTEVKKKICINNTVTILSE